ncbi:hypothetical protein ACHWQZ_G002469 [Mnemiopsis leidyi]
MGANRHTPLHIHHSKCLATANLLVFCGLPSFFIVFSTYYFPDDFNKWWNRYDKPTSFEIPTPDIFLAIQIAAFVIFGIGAFLVWQVGGYRKRGFQMTGYWLVCIGYGGSFLAFIYIEKLLAGLLVLIVSTALSIVASFMFGRINCTSALLALPIISWHSYLVYLMVKIIQING